MQATSQLWQSLWSGGNARLETVAVIEGTEYTAISSPVISRALMQDDLSVGNAVSATCQLSLLTDDSIPRAAEVRIKMRLSDGTQTSEWLPAGTFYVSHRDRDAVTGLLSLECYDSLLKANANAETLSALYEALEENGDGLYPCPMADMAALIAALLGVELDARNDLATGDDYRIEQPEAGASVHDILSRIGAANGGNWIITPANRLRLVPVAPPLNSDFVTVDGIVASFHCAAGTTITGIRYGDGESTHLIGTDAGAVVNADVTASVAQRLAGWIIGRTYQPFEMQGAIYDPAAELGDCVERPEDVQGVLVCETATLGLAFRGNLSAPEPGEMADEFPYVGDTERAFRNLRAVVATKASVSDVDAAEARANAVTAALNAALNQQGIFNRLTNNGQTQGVYLKDGKLYINGSYIDTGTLNADLIRAGVISDASGQNYWVLDGNNSEFVTRKGTIGDFSLENGALQYSNNTISAYIGKSGVYFGTSGGNPTKTAIFAQGLKFYWNGVEKTDLYLYQDGLEVLCYDENNARWLGIQLNCDEDGHTVYLGGDTRVNGKLRVDNELRARWTIYGERQLMVEGNVSAFADLQVYGTKSRVVETEDYARRLLYCYETPTPMFGDVGEGVIAEDGRCWVWLDAIFAQTITDGQYQVFLQGYGPGECRVAERRPGYFVVSGSPGMAFGWEVKARQRDFDQRRLDEPIAEAQDAATDFGEMALEHIENLNRGRMEA